MTADEKLKLMTDAADELKAENVEILNLEGKTILADYFVICTGASDVHIRAIANKMQEAMANAGIKRGRIEGYAHAVWVLLDYGDVVGHVMRKEQREFYDLEKFWQNAPNIDELRLQEESRQT